MCFCVCCFVVTFFVCGDCCPSRARRSFFSFYVLQKLYVCGCGLGALLFLLINAFDALVFFFYVFCALSDFDGFDAWWFSCVMLDDFYAMGVIGAW